MKPCRAARPGALAVLALPVALASRPARADAPPAQLAVAIELRDADCLEPRSLVAGVGRYLGRETVDARVHVTVRETPKGVTFTLQSGESSWEQAYAIPRASCAQRRDAIPLGLAMAIDALLLAPPPAPPPPPPSPPPPVPPPPPAPVTKPAAAEPPRSPGEAKGTTSPGTRLGVSASIAVVGLANVVPGLAIGVAPAIGLRLGEHLDIEASFLGTSASSVALGPRSAEVGLLAGAAAACFARRGVIEVRGCASVAAGAVHVDGNDVSPGATQGAWAAVGLGLDARLKLTERFGVFAGLSGYLPVVRPVLTLVSTSQAPLATRSLPVAGAALGIGPSMIFW